MLFRRTCEMSLVFAAALGMGLKIAFGIVMDTVLWVVYGTICGAGVSAVAASKTEPSFEGVEFWKLVQEGAGYGVTIGLIFASVRLFQKAKNFPKPSPSMEEKQ